MDDYTTEDWLRETSSPGLENWMGGIDRKRYLNDPKYHAEKTQVIQLAKAVREGRLSLEAILEEAQSQLKEAREALGFYGDAKNHEDIYLDELRTDRHGMNYYAGRRTQAVIEDGGNRARAAIEKLKEG